MARGETKTIEVHARAEDFGVARDFMTQTIDASGISEEEAADTRVVFEALFNSVLAQGFDPDTALSISEHRKHGDVHLEIEFEGEHFNPYPNAGGPQSPDEELLQSYADKFDCSYRLGCNSVSVSVRRGGSFWTFPSIVAMLLAVVVYVILANVWDRQTQQSVAHDYLYHIGTLCSNAALMISAPVTLFSLLKNLTDAFIIQRRNSNVRLLHFRALGTSVVCILLAMVVGWWLCSVYDVGALVPAEQSTTTFAKMSFADDINAIIPSSIIEPLETTAPLPLIIVSIICTYALCSVGKHFDILKKGIDACYELFAKMLQVVLVALPPFSFLAILYTLFADGPLTLGISLLTVAFILLSLCVVAVYYILRLKVSGVKLMAFAKGLPALLVENWKINSIIDAVPFNVRFCSKVYGMDRRRLSYDLPVLAQINRDGNCYLLMMVAIMSVFPSGLSKVSALEIYVLAFLVLFLSLGSPNQPGSILIGTVIIAQYLNIQEVWILGVFLEVFLGRAQNATNVLGDIVMAAIDDAKDKAKG